MNAFQGFKNGKVDNMIESRARYYDKLRASLSFQQAQIKCLDYRASKPPPGALVYCDPPYTGTQGYGKDQFNSDEFWDVMRNWSRDSIVFISEYAAPEDFVEYASSKKQMTLGGGHTQQTRIEKLYIHSSALDRMPPVHAT